MAIPIPKKTGFQEFPKWMRHPAEREAVVCDEREVDPATGRERWVNKPPGQPVKFPPCMALDADQEAYFRAQGYLAADGDAAAYSRATVAPLPDGYVHREYPLMLPDGTIDLGPDAPQPPDNFYPYWLRSPGYEPTLVQDVEEHQAVLRERGIEPPKAPSDEDEIEELEWRLAELRAKKAERPAQTLPSAAADPAANEAEAPGPVEDRPAEIDLQAPEKLAELLEGQSGEVVDINVNAKTAAEAEVTARLAELEAEEPVARAPAHEAQAKGGKRR